MVSFISSYSIHRPTPVQIQYSWILINYGCGWGEVDIWCRAGAARWSSLGIADPFNGFAYSSIFFYQILDVKVKSSGDFVVESELPSRTFIVPLLLSVCLVKYSVTLQEGIQLCMSRCFLLARRFLFYSRKTIKFYRFKFCPVLHGTPCAEPQDADPKYSWKLNFVRLR